MFNKTIIVGNLCRDPELRYTPKGTSLCTFSLACNRKFKDDSGNERDEVLFIDVEAWTQKAELVHKYLVKGSQCLVEGRLKMDEWEDKVSKQKRTKVKLVLENVQFLGAPRNRDGAPPATAPMGDKPIDGAYKYATRPPAASKAVQENLDEDVPF